LNCVDEFRDFFSKFGNVMNHEIIRDHATSRPRGFGFIVFDSEKAVDDLFAKRGNMIDLNGAQVSLANKKIRRVVSQIAKITSYINNKA
jgi:heterogeneous nuclear ribonucleoprotein A1/A3